MKSAIYLAGVLLFLHALVVIAGLMFLAQGPDNPFLRKIIQIGAWGGLLSFLLFLSAYLYRKEGHDIASLGVIGIWVQMIVFYLILIWFILS